MSIYTKKKQRSLTCRILSSLIAFNFSLSMLIPPQALAQLIPQTAINLPVPGTMLSVSEGYMPTLIKGITLNPDDAMEFDFIVDPGQSGLQGEAFGKEATKLVKYFLATLTVPEQDLWVNLSPYEKDRIIPDGLGQTEMGRDLLAQDYILKQLTSSMMYPEDELGKTFWERVYQKAQEKFGTTEIPLNTFNKIWIVPQKAVVYEHEQSAYVIDSYLKVMLEEDYVALQKNLGEEKLGMRVSETSDAEMISGISSEVVREVLIPEIETEVNRGKNFASLRQIYNSMILAAWYKINLKQSLLNRVYADQNKTKGIDVEDKQVSQKIYDQYLEAFKKGAYDYIREDYDPATQEVIPRKYFSGGAPMNKVFNVLNTLTEVPDQARKSAVQALTSQGPDLAQIVTVKMSDFSKDADPALISKNVGEQQKGNGIFDQALLVKHNTKMSDNEKNFPIYFFGIDGDELPRATREMKKVVGGKGANVAHIANMGPGFKKWLSENLNDEAWLKKRGITREEIEAGLIKSQTAPGFTVSTEQTGLWKEKGEVLSDELWARTMDAIHLLEKQTGKKLGDTVNDPLYVSVRSGAAESMPGMMDTILNSGQTLSSVMAFIKATGNEALAWDNYRRFIEMYGRTVFGIEDDEHGHVAGFKLILDTLITERKKVNPAIKDQKDLTVKDNKELIEKYLKLIKEKGFEIPADPYEQIKQEIITVMRSTFNERAIEYRKIYNIELEKTLSAVNVQAMIYGNKDARSGSGVAFSRDVATGRGGLNARFQFKTQGEDVVAGRVEGLPYEELLKRERIMALNLALNAEYLEKVVFKDAQDIEFTFQTNLQGEPEFYLLQTRNAKRTSQAQFELAWQMVEEKLITKEEAVRRITAQEIANQILSDRLDPEEKKKAKVLSKNGMAASPGAGVGMIALTSAKAILWREQNVPSILVRPETTPEDLGGMYASRGILTTRGDMTSHAAVVARQMGRPAIVGDTSLEIDMHNRTVTFTLKDGTKIVKKEGDYISIDGLTGKGEPGEAYEGKVKVIDSIVMTARDRELALNEAKTMRDENYEAIGAVDKMSDLDPDLKVALKAEYKMNYKLFKDFVAKFENEKFDKIDEVFYQHFMEVTSWAIEQKVGRGGLKVKANAETPLDVLRALYWGEGIGLARTEHMFSEHGRDLIFQRFILAESVKDKQAALKELAVRQQVDFEQIFKIAALNNKEKAKPVTVRLVDPPIHEFLPREDDKTIELAIARMGLVKGEEFEKILDSTRKQIKNAEDARKLNLDDKLKVYANAFSLKENVLKNQMTRTKELINIERAKEKNPMFGKRGVRLGIAEPELIEMQAEAMFKALRNTRERGYSVNLEIMVPLVGRPSELEHQKAVINKVAQRMGIKEDEFNTIGTMIEITAGAVNAGKLAKGAKFFSVGTNDLVQSIFGFSRDDLREYLINALKSEVFKYPPFVTLPPEAVPFVKRIVREARKANPGIPIGVCGEHGVDATTILNVWGLIGMNSVSGNAKALPGAIFAAAQAAEKEPLDLGEGYPEVKLKNQPFEKIAEMISAATLKEQFETALHVLKFRENFVVNNDRVQLKKDLLANLNFALPIGMDWADVQDDENFKTILGWAEEIKKTGVKVITDEPFSKESIGMDGVDIITTDKYLTEVPETRGLVQAYLLEDNKDKKKEYLVKFTAWLLTLFNENLPGHDVLGTSRPAVSFPNIDLGAVFHYANEGDQNTAINNLSKKLDISVEEVHKRIEKYHEANPAIAKRGSRVFFLDSAPLYIAIARAVIESAKAKQYREVDLLLPFVSNAKEVEVIRDGYFDKIQHEELVPDLKEAIEDIRGSVDVQLGAIIESGAGVATAGDIANTLMKSASPGRMVKIVVNARRLTENTFAMFEEDAKGLILPTYLEMGIFDQNIFEKTPPEAQQLMVEAIDAITKIGKERVKVSVITNPLDTDTMALSLLAGAGITVPKGKEDVLAPLVAANAVVTKARDWAMVASLDSKNKDIRPWDEGERPLEGEIDQFVTDAITQGKALGLPNIGQEASRNGETPKTKGGIDLNPAFLDWQIKRDENGVALPVWQQPIDQLNIGGIIPIIIRVRPIYNLPLTLGLVVPENNQPEKQPAEQLSSNMPAGAMERRDIFCLTRQRSNFFSRI